MKEKQYKDREPCTHKGCLSHRSHPCEGCGRIAGISKPKDIEASLSLLCEVTCLKCDEEINLFEIDSIVEEGHIYKMIFDETDNGRWGNAENFNKKIKCPECKTIMNVKNINY